MPRYFHVTPLTNVQSILADGLIPQIGERSQLLGETKPSIYLFNSAEALEGACLNWLEDCFDDEDQLALIAVDLPDDIVLQSTVEYEVTTQSVINPLSLSVLSFDLMNETNLSSLLNAPAVSELPSIRVNTVYHIGTLELKDKGTRGGSFEAHMLSVSTCPLAWKSIAKLGGYDLHLITKDDALFIDMVAASRDVRFRDMVEQWSIAQGLAEKKELWKAWSYDDDLRDWMFTLHRSREAAECEVDKEGGSGPNGLGLVEPSKVLVSTQKLASRINAGQPGVEDAFDYAAIAWLEDTQPQFDGAWWLEEYAPEHYSAPRGGILPGKLAQFQTQKISWQDAPYDKEANKTLRQTSTEIAEYKPRCAIKPI